MLFRLLITTNLRTAVGRQKESICYLKSIPHEIKQDNHFLFYFLFIKRSIVNKMVEDCVKNLLSKNSSKLSRFCSIALKSRDLHHNHVVISIGYSMI